MRLIFAGTPEFAVPALDALIKAGHDVVMVLTQPDRPAGRGMQLKASPVKTLAVQHGLDILQPETLKDAAAQARIAAVQAEAMVVAAYGLMIPDVVLAMPRRGCLNIHASLLPRWRGAAPIQRAILAGDRTTGITIMQVVPRLDAGPMLKQAAIPIRENDTAQTLHDALALLGARLMVEVLAELDDLKAIPQDEMQATYAAKLQKAEAPLDWSRSAVELSRQVRAFNPYPVAQALFRGEPWRIWFARALPRAGGRPGEVLKVDQGIWVACGTGTLRIEELQRPGGRRLDWKAFLAGNPLQPGDRFDVQNSAGAA
jgi:methionyl-tRNA formyltransferase